MTAEERLLSIDGIDGSGKSTQVDAVCRALDAWGLPTRAITTHAFGARTVNALAEQMTGDPFAYHPTIPAHLREWTFACDVAQYCRVHMLPLLRADTTVVWDQIGRAHV